MRRLVSGVLSLLAALVHRLRSGGWSAGPLRERAPPLPAPAPAPERGAPLDLRRLQALRDIEQRGVPGYVAQLVGIFLADAPERVRRMRSALARGDGPALRAEAHVLLSASATVGAVEIARRCEALEEQAQGGRLTGETADLDALAAQFALVAPLLIKWAGDAP